MEASPQTGNPAAQPIRLPVFRKLAPPPATSLRPTAPAAQTAPGAPVQIPKPLTPAAPLKHPKPAPGVLASPASLAKLILESLAPGDKLVVKSLNTTYRFEMGENFRCQVTTEKPGTRSGEVELMGGMNADGTEYTPNRIHVGGRMAYKFPDEQTCVLTSVLESISLAKRPAAA